MKTFSREHFEAAKRAWSDGDFSDEWKPYRHAAAMAGFIYPPEGTKWDSWDEDEPSQRAILIRVIRERPEWLMSFIPQCKNWGEVIAGYLREYEWLARGVAEEDRYDRRQRTLGEPTQAEAAQSLRAIWDKTA